jgi:pantoate--beta-alanine ligase
LLNIVAPHKAYFGQKDLQQYLIIKKISKDFSYLTEIVMCATVREADGLALSSRNLRLTKEEREKAPLLFKTLKAAAAALKIGESAHKVKKKAFDSIASEKLFTPEYVEILDLESFELLDDTFKSDVAICVSAHLGKARLIDNVIMQV